MGEYWAVWNVGEYTFSPFKLVWREISKEFEAAVIGTFKMKPLLEKVAIPDHKLMMVPFADKREAHFYCAILNSTLFRSFASAISTDTSYGTRIFESIGLPRFDSEDPTHISLSELSIAAHKEPEEIDEHFEEKLNNAVSEVISDFSDMASLETREHLLVGMETVEDQVWTDALIERLRLEVAEAESEITEDYKVPLEEIEYVAIDLETTGFGTAAETYAHRIVEIGIVRFTLDEIKDEWSQRLWPCRPIDEHAVAVHGIVEDILQEEPTFWDVAEEVLEKIGDNAVVVMHNYKADLPLLKLQLAEAGFRLEVGTVIDTLKLLRSQFGLPSGTLRNSCAFYGIEEEDFHTALGDARATAHLLCKLIKDLKGRADIRFLGNVLLAQGEIDHTLISPVSRLPAQVSEWIANRQRVRIVQERDEGPRPYVGELVGAAFGEKMSYYSIVFPGGKRILLREDKVTSIEAYESNND